MANQGAVQVIAPTVQPVTVTLLLAGTPVTLYSDSAATVPIGTTATIASAATQTLYVSTAGNYKMSVHDGTTEISRPFSTKLLDLALSAGDVATRDYSSVVVSSTDQSVGSGGSGSTPNVLGSPSNPVTNAAAARPAGLTVVYWLTATQPTNLAIGDVWESTV